MADNACEEDVRRMSMDELCEILDRENVDYSELEDVEEIRDLVLQSIAQRISPNNERHSQKEATIDVMGRILERDAEMRKVIRDIYDSVLAMLDMKNFEKNLGSEMTKEYNGYIGTIFNSEQKRAVVTDENGGKIYLDDVTEETLSKYVCVDRSGENTQRYKTVDIYWPIPMLKEHATIVDTPGVGESDEMTTKLLDYLSEAVAFIYVINTTNAGGVQDDRLVKIFKKQLELEQKGLLQQFDPECAIFVCNKWDQVPDSEGEMVWKDISKKLQANWPTRRNIDITGQMFKMSVTKDLQRSKAGLGYSEKFKALISGIDRLVRASLERRVKKHVDWLQSFLDRLLIKVIAKINASRKNQEEKKAMKSEIEKRLKTLECETEIINDNIAKIADVGMSKPKNQLQGTITGTPVFMAPEVLEGRMYGLSADIFSLSIMMWEMWYGRRVFSESVYSDVMTTYSSIKSIDLNIFPEVQGTAQYDLLPEANGRGQ
uniref:Serine/threonine-protein kinase atg1 n=1 Tax=Magallana gigas TaxID=29159 RepID=K1QJ91_MAGGI